jgi:hypothetical protein
MISVGHVEIIFSSFGSMKDVEVTNVLRIATPKICFCEGLGLDESVSIRETPLSTVWLKGQIRLPILFVFR